MQPQRARFSTASCIKMMQAVQLIMILHVMMMGSINAACKDNIQAANFAQGTQLLKSTVLACVGGTPFSMPTGGVSLLSNNIPNDFHTQNANRALVEIIYEVRETTGRQRIWSITVDVDNATATQRAHYGYTIFGTNPKINKVTGHIFFPAGVVPPYVRPELGAGDGYNIVNFAASASSFSLNGANHYLKHH